MQSIFGTDGIRGRFNEEITYSLAYKVGYALGSNLENNYPILKGGTFIIHTNKEGHIDESASSKSQKQLLELRKLANQVDRDDNNIKAVVSVLMLKEGWDVKNVSTVVGLRPFSHKANILPEQTLGRGLRKM